MSLIAGFLLGSPTTSKQFSEVFHALTGDGLTSYGGRFPLKLQSGLSVSVGPGFAFAAGRWLRSDETVLLRLPPSWNYDDRYDAIAVRANEAERMVELMVLEGVSPDPPPKEDEDSLYLYLAHVRRGATTLYETDLKDTRGDSRLCGEILPLSGISGAVLEIYTFLTSGIDLEIARIIALAQVEIQKAEYALEELGNAVHGKTGNQIGDIVSALTCPEPKEGWLLCDGGSVPEQYAALKEAIGDTLPNIPQKWERFRTWIFAGSAGGTTEKEGPYNVDSLCG